MIQGSEGSLHSTQGHISREDYVERLRSTTITQGKDRHNVYDLFEKYQKLKTVSYQHDVADRYVYVR